MKLTARGTLQLQLIMFCCSATIAAKVKDGRRVGGRAPETTPDQTPVSAFAALPGAPTCLCAMIVERLCRRHPAGGRRGAPGGLAAAPGAPGRAGRQRQADGLEWRGTRRVAAPHRIGLHSDQSQHPASPRRALQAPQQHLRSGLWRTRLPPCAARSRSADCPCLPPSRPIAQCRLHHEGCGAPARGRGRPQAPPARRHVAVGRRGRGCAAPAPGQGRAPRPRLLGRHPRQSSSPTRVCVPLQASTLLDAHARTHHRAHPLALSLLLLHSYSPCACRLRHEGR